MNFIGDMNKDRFHFIRYSRNSTYMIELYYSIVLSKLKLM